MSPTIKSGKDEMDIQAIHRFLSMESYWAKGISFELVEHSLSHSFCIGAFKGDEQIAFGRMITDYTTFGWLADFFVLPPYRGQSISKVMVSHIMELPWAKRLRRIMLNTSDAHGLYRQYGFEDLKNPSFILEIYRPSIHLQHKLDESESLSDSV